MVHPLMLEETEKLWFQMRVDPEEMDRKVTFQLWVKDSLVSAKSRACMAYCLQAGVC